MYSIAEFFDSIRTRNRWTTHCTLISSMPVLAAGLLALPQSAHSQNDPCREADDADTVICTGDQSDGIASGIDFNDPGSALEGPFTVLEVNGLSGDDGIPIAIEPGQGQAGIDFTSDTANNLTIISGAQDDVVTINTSDAPGIRLESDGIAAPPDPNDVDPVLGIHIPGESKVSSGQIEVDSYSAITTTGDNAHGISGESSTRGIHPSVAANLSTFIAEIDANGVDSLFEFDVVTVGTVPDQRSDDNIDAAVTGERLNDNGTLIGIEDLQGFSDEIIDGLIAAGFETIASIANAELADLQAVPEIGDAVALREQAIRQNDGGQFTISGVDGSFTFDFGSAFDDLGVGETSFTRVTFETEVANLATGATRNYEGFLTITVRRQEKLDANGDPIVTNGVPETELVTVRPVDPIDGTESSPYEALYDELGGRLTEDTVFPDLRAYADALRDDALNGGGAGNEVRVVNQGTIITMGNGADGIYANSRGASPPRATSTNHGYRGKNGGDVIVDANGTITTVGDESSGVKAHSQAGNGGEGGRANFGNSGGWGGTGGDGGLMEIHGDGTINTTGTDASGIHAESHGGDGGNGGNSSATKSGGRGGGAGSGGTVNVNGIWTITTTGDKSRGIWARSLGGRGGLGSDGSWFSGGRVGGGATDGGAVTVVSGGTISTWGDYANGVDAQSIGGFGGKGGEGDSIFAAFGGDGQGAGNGGVVNVTNAGTIETHGFRANAIFAESIGGGGGNGGGSGFGLFRSEGGVGARGGNGDDVTVTNKGTLRTDGDDASAVFAQSVGGEGGKGGDSRSFGVFVSVAIGGDGGEGGYAGELVNVDNQGVIATTGDRSHGILAQSVGGGGGKGGYAQTLAIGAGFSVKGVGVPGISVAVAQGGSGGKGGAAKEVSVTSNGSISTQGKDSHGVLAQSVGGGGGIGGYSFAMSAGSDVAVSVALGGSGGDGGDGGKVTVTNGPGEITTGRVNVDSMRIEDLVLPTNLGPNVQTLLANEYTTVAELLEATADEVAAAAGLNGDKNAEVGELENLGISALTINKLRDENFDLIGDLQVKSIDDLIKLSFDSQEAAAIVAAVESYVLTVPEVLVDMAWEQIQQGDHSYGILAQSVGGGGGDGGASFAGSIALTGAAAAAFSMGGSGGKGGNSDTVSVSNDGNITTYGGSSHAIVAQSIGGAGGTGGLSGSGTLVLGPSKGAVAATVSIGGNGGKGGNGEVVTVHNWGNIVTHARGPADDSTVPEDPDLTDPGSVVRAIEEPGRLQTLGQGAIGILAQSIGGGGGDGGFSFAGAVTAPQAAAGTVSAAIGVAIGGSGESGGIGDAVNVNNFGSIETFGGESHGVQAQSIGGGGGNGGQSIALTASIANLVSDPNAFLNLGDYAANVSVAVGGKGGKGNTGGVVTVTNGSQSNPNGHVSTHGHDAHAIFAQSIGGGGGHGGSSLSGNLNLDRIVPDPAREGTTVNFAIAVGGVGGEGNTGGDVEVTNHDWLTTSGNNSHGIYAQSIGGGGGDGGKADGIQIALSDLQPFFGIGNKDRRKQILDSNLNNYQFELALGGDGGKGNDGGNVTVTNKGNIFTEGALARGIYAQSIGAGGGTIAEGVLAILSDEDDAGDRADQIGAGFDFINVLSDPKPDSLSVTVGGDEGASGDAKTVTVANSGDIWTQGMSGHAIAARSIGGGGGEAQRYATVENTGEKGDTEDLGVALFGGFAVGGKGGAAGHGDTVSIVQEGNLLTEGEAAFGIYAQSIGGGGGQAGAATGGFGSLTSIGFQPAFLKDSGGGGNGGRVEIDTSGDIATTGGGSIGIFAQSIGGGGGVKGDISGLFGMTNIPTAFLGSAGGDGSGSTVSVIHAGSITTWGVNAHGIFAQSAGGIDEDDTDDGTPSDMLLGLGGDVCVTVGEGDNHPCQDPNAPPGPADPPGGSSSNAASGAIQTLGDGGMGIFAQSSGGDGAGNIHIFVEENWAVIGGSGDGAGIVLKDGLNNQVDIKGFVSTQSGIDGMALYATTGNDLVNNYGTVSGSVDLGAGTNAFTNHASAFFNAGRRINLGDGNSFINSGTLSPGGVGGLGTTGLTGNYVQDSSGVFAVDAHLEASDADLFVISGAANLDGMVVVNTVSSGSAMPGTRVATILYASSGVTDAGVDLAFPESAIVNYSLVFPNSNELQLEIDVDFMRDAFELNANQTAIGGYIDDMQRGGGSAKFEPTMAALIAQPNAEGLKVAYNSLSPEISGVDQMATLYSSMRFGDALMSCKARGGAVYSEREGQCAWIRVAYGDSKRDETAKHMGYNEYAWQQAMGAQFHVGENWVLGGAFSMERRNVGLMGGSAASDGRQVQFGLVAKRQFGPTRLSTSLTGGYADLDIDRFVAPGNTARGENLIHFVGGLIRGEHTFEYANSYLNPRIDLGVTHISMDGYKEQGRGGANLTVGDSSDTHVYTQLALEYGSKRTFENGNSLRPHLSIGLTNFLSDASPAATAAFQAAPMDVDKFTVASELDRQYLGVDLGVDIFTKSDLVIQLDAYGRASDNTSELGGSLKLSFLF